MPFHNKRGRLGPLWRKRDKVVFIYNKNLHNQHFVENSEKIIPG